MKVFDLYPYRCERECRLFDREFLVNVKYATKSEMSYIFMWLLKFLVIIEIFMIFVYSEQSQRVYSTWVSPQSTPYMKTFLEGNYGREGENGWLIGGIGLFAKFPPIISSLYWMYFVSLRPNCFQVVVRALGESRMTYLCADTQDQANVSTVPIYFPTPPQ